MRTLVSDPPPPEFELMQRERERLGHDRWDEVWDGVLHMNPPPSFEHERLVMAIGRALGLSADEAGLTIVGQIGLGHSQNHRVPDVSLMRSATARPQWQTTAALVVEIVSPGDDSWEKFDHYAAHHVDEVVIVDPEKRSVDWFALRSDDGRYEPVQRSGVIATGRAELLTRLDYPA